MEVGAALIQRLRDTYSDIFFPLFNALDLLALTSVSDGFRYRIPPTARCFWIPLCGVGGIVRVLWIWGCFLTGVCCRSACTGNGFRNFVCRPMVLVPFDEGDSWITEDLPDINRVVE